MIRSFQILPNAQLGVAASTLYTCPAKMRATPKQLSIANTSGTATPVTVYVVPNGGTAANSNTIVPGITVPPNSVLSLAPYLANVVLVEGDTIQALAGTATRLTPTGGGIEETV